MTRALTTNEFLIKAKAKHPDVKYDYSKTTYKTSSTPVIIICPEHGEFTQRPNDHLNGNGCRKCGISKANVDRALSQDTFVKACKEKHGGKYDYSKVVYKTSSEKITIICPEHGEFTQGAGSHKGGKGCPKCAVRATIEGRKGKGKWGQTTEGLVKRFVEVHGDLYSYDKAVWNGPKTEVTITCKIHGDFQQFPSAHKRGQGCMKCAIEGRTVGRGKMSTQSLKARVLQMDLSDKYTYLNLDTIHEDNHKLKIVCSKHGEFEQYVYNHLAGSGCPKCASSGISKVEAGIASWLERLVKIETSNRTLLGGKEIDILIPEKKVGFEFNGLYWHSSNSTEDDADFQNMHIDKTNMCEKNGVQLYHIFENEWKHKREIWQSVILNAIGKTPDKIFARKCTVVEVSDIDARKFCLENHLQGPSSSSVRLGLEYDGILVSLMTFGKPRFNNEHDFELLRFCNMCYTSVVGGASKLLKAFFRKHPGAKLVSYANRRWSNGSLYRSLGFTQMSIGKPAYWYFKMNEEMSTLKHRSAYMKHMLECKLDNFDPYLTEVENMYENGFRRIWDSGSITFSLTDPSCKAQD